MLVVSTALFFQLVAGEYVPRLVSCYWNNSTSLLSSPHLLHQNSVKMADQVILTEEVCSVLVFHCVFGVLVFSIHSILPSFPPLRSQAACKSARTVSF